MKSLALGAALLLQAHAAAAQTAEENIRNMAAADAASRAAYNAAPDTPGTGPFPARKEMDAGLPAHVVYRPADLKALGGRKLGVLVWGNGGCMADGASARWHLSEIASHGYVAIAPGTIQSGPGGTPDPAARRAMGADGRLPQIRTTTADVLAGLDWILAENGRPGSPYFGLIDPAQVAAAGHSCGGLQAIQAGTDPRIRTVIVHNSGIFADGSNPITGMTVDKSLLKKLHTPVLYILGGKTDVAWPNGTDDFRLISHVPVVLLDVDVGHGGTFRQPNGGKVAAAAVDWLNWQLRGDAQAAKTFTGADCTLCQNPEWKVERKGL